ncbi:3-isopropylmalate dehydratase [Microbaculum marinisediminis]|uniref:3-isopropylmalate dehydratase small subunit n=1 Tax=Microbaculum marinisediminis TaxID=2931392 RepID=A0AAW5R3G7_9HYPH|nr:3-isopropylmalate dehydratase [Microbaculum sp. A6E488]MCT8973664.1 3-isopropylmalate dehydratase [Microbaculum sp. A6E488]
MTTGRAFVYGDDIDTDQLAPGQYMAAPIETLAAHCLEAVDPAFASTVGPGDVIVAGRNFGMGSSREQAAQALKALGVAGIVARSFAGIFHRNAINVGLPVFTADVGGPIAAGDAVKLDVAGACLVNETRGGTIDLDPLPAFLLELINDGGLVPHLEKRFAKTRADARVQKESRV